MMDDNDDDGCGVDDVYDCGVRCYCAELQMDSTVLMRTYSQHGPGWSLSSLRRAVVPSVTDHRPVVALHGHHRHRHRYRGHCQTWQIYRTAQLG